MLVIVAEGTGAEASSEVAYDAAGRRQASLDPRGTVMRVFYDVDGREFKTVVNCTDDTSNPAPPPPTGDWWNCQGTGVEDGTWNVTSSRTYDDAGDIETEAAPNGRVTRYRYDDANRLKERIDNDVEGSPTAPDQEISTFYAYDDAGRQVAVRTPTADRTTFSVTRYIYDAEGQLVAEISNCTDDGTTPPGDQEWMSCSGEGTHDASTNLVTAYEYDQRGIRVAVTRPDPSATAGSTTATVTTRYAYDEAGRLCGVLENATVGLAADPCATNVAGTDSENVWTSYAYDGASNLVSMTDGEGQATLYGYDERGQMISLTDADGGTTTWTYDDLGRRISQTVRGGSDILVAWTYDAAGRMTGRTADDETTTYAYDDNGNRTSISSPAGTISVSYDLLNRPLTVTVSNDPGAATGYTYSLDSPSWTDPSGSYTATLDAFDRQIALTDPIHAQPWIFAFRADGQPASVDAPNGTVTDFAYDPAASLVDKTTTRTSDGATIADYAWTHNQAANILTETSTIDGDPTNGITTYAYDPLGRLTSYDRVGSTTAYGWQAVPNRASVQVEADPAVTTTYDQANRPISDSAGGSYASDGEGRLIARPGQTLEWDDLGRLVAVRNSESNGLMAAYTYDALDRLLTVDHGDSDRIRFRYVGLTTQVAQMVDDTNNNVGRSIANDWTGGRLLDWTGFGANQHFYGTNGHHDVTWTADTSGAITATLRYDPWGNLVASTGPELPGFRFQGSWFDASVELSWMVARWYAPNLGRFVSEDYLLGQIVAPPSRHLYAYVNGNPLQAWDPTGTCSVTLVYLLNCTLGDFDAMTAGQRRTWMEKFQKRYAASWFNGVVGVLKGSKWVGMIDPQRNWFSRVDAYILAAIQDGQRMYQRKYALVPGNPANVWWQTFFVRLARGAKPAYLRYYWGTAEQSATDYGMRHTWRWPTFAEVAIKNTTVCVASGRRIWRRRSCHPSRRMQGAIVGVSRLLFVQGGV